MGSLTIFSVLTFIVATVLIYSQAAPVTEFFGPPQTIEGDRNVIYPNTERVEEMERFHRTNKDGSVEFKMALSNGHVQYQKISSKFIDGEKVSVYKGYISERYNDGSYGTRYYAADENGYRTTDVLVENKPPVLPSSGSFSVNGPRGITIESASVNDDDIQNKTNSLKDELYKIQHDLEDEQLSSLNLGSKITKVDKVTTNESGQTKLEEQDPSNDQIAPNVEGIQTDLPFQSDATSSTELPLISNSEENNGKVSEEPESSTLPALQERSSTASAVDLSSGEHNEERSSTEENIGKLDEQSSDPLTTPASQLEISTDQPLPEVSSEDDGSSTELPTATTETLLNHEDTTTTEQQLSDNEVTTEASEILRTDGRTSKVSTYPLDNADSDSRTLSFIDVISTTSDEEQVTDSSTEPILGGTEDKSPSPIDSETETNSEISTTSLAPEIDSESTLPTEKSNEYEIKSEVSTELPLTDSTTSANIEDVTNESHEFSTDTPIDLENSSIYNKEARSLGISTDSPHSEDNKSISIEEGSGNSSEEGISETSEKTSSATTEESKNIIDRSTEPSGEERITTLAPESDSRTEVKIDSDSSTEQPTALIGSDEKSNENSEEKLIKDESNTQLPDQSRESISETTTETEVLSTTPEKSSNESDKESNEASTEVPSKSEDSSDSNKEARNLDASTELPLSEGNNSTSIVKESGNSSEENVSESGNAIEKSTEQPEKSSDDSIISTTSSSSEKSDSTTVTAKDSDSSTEQPTALTEIEEKSIENQSSTELPSEESSEEGVRTTEAIEETTTEAEVEQQSTTQENEEKSHGVEIDFYPPVIHF